MRKCFASSWQPFNFDLLGFDDDELVRLLASEDAIQGLTDEDAIPALPETPVSAAADLFILGVHKLLVGDALDSGAVAGLMGADAADLVFSDLPYNVDYEGYTEDRLKIKNDRMSEADFRKFLAVAFRSFRGVVKPGASLYVCHPSSSQREFQDALEAAGFEVRCQIIWAKNTFAWGFGRYKFQHESIFYCHLAGQKDPWYGDKSQSTLWQENKPAANRLHPTMKPVELVERALANSSKAGDLVVDLFGGSGSTLIGCERRGVKGGVKLDHCSCIISSARTLSHASSNNSRSVSRTQFTVHRRTPSCPFTGPPTFLPRRYRASRASQYTSLYSAFLIAEFCIPHHASETNWR
jgi:DNA modification methylase